MYTKQKSLQNSANILSVLNRFLLSGLLFICIVSYIKSSSKGFFVQNVLFG